MAPLLLPKLGLQDPFGSRHFSVRDEVDRKGRLGLVFTALALLLIAPMAVGNYLAGKEEVALVLVVLVVIFTLSARLYVTRRIQLGAHLSLLAGTVGLETITYMKGAVLASPIGWYPPLLLVIGFLLPARQTTPWVVLWAGLRLFFGVWFVPDSYDAETLGPPMLYATSSAGALIALHTMATVYRVSLSRAHAAAEKAAEAASLASHAKSAFLANMSHEIRTPLHGVLGLTDVLITTDPGPEERARFLRTIQRSGRTLLAILDDVLDVSRIEAGAMSIELGPTHVREIIHDTEQLFGEAVRLRGLALESHVSDGVCAVVITDGFRVRQILSNLVGNALKFTESGTITVEVTAQDAMLVFSVRDTGCGIDPERIPRLFDAFQQQDASTTRRFGGSGLGLAISSKLAELLDGDLEMDSEIGRGTQVRLRVPLRPASTAEHAEAVPSTSVPMGRSANIVVAEDNSTNQLVIRALLQRLGHTVHVVPDGLQLLDYLRANPLPDLILMDCHMPEMDGFDATRAIRADVLPGISELPVIALTASVMEDDRLRCMDCGMDAVLTKPIDPATLSDAIQHWLEARRRAA